MRQNNHRFCALAIITFAFQPFVGLVFGDTPATERVSYSSISIDIPNSSRELGLTTLEDSNNEGEIV